MPERNSVRLVSRLVEDLIDETYYSFNLKLVLIEKADPKWLDELEKLLVAIKSARLNGENAKENEQ